MLDSFSAAVRKAKPEVSTSDIEHAVREWLRTASDRDGGRKRRNKDIPNQEQNADSSL